MKETYPAVFEHLKQFEDKLRKRGQCEGTATSPGSNQHHWLELDNNVSQEKLDDFSKQKILFSEMVSSPQFYLDCQNFLVNDTVTFISGENLESLTIFLNSKIIFSIFKLFYAGGGLGNSGIRMKKTFLQKLPLPRIVIQNVNFKDQEILISNALTLTDDEFDYLLEAFSI